jgi:DNA-binding HxlR family transcriptional regulator
MKTLKRSVCPVACTLDLLGDKWTLLVVRDLFTGRRYFKEFLASPEGIATNILTDRLGRLVAAGIVDTHPDAGTAGRFTYRLTAKGASLMPVLESIRDWGLRNIKGTTARIKHPLPQPRRGLRGESARE